MRDYKKETQKMVLELMEDLVSRKAIAVKEIEVDWKTEKVTNCGENSADFEESTIIILVPKIAIKFS